MAARKKARLIFAVLHYAVGVYVTMRRLSVCLFVRFFVTDVLWLSFESNK